MCNESILKTEAAARERFGFTRREFGLLLASGAAIALLPGPLLAADVSESSVAVPTPDGMADCYFVHPAQGAHPGVLLWPDFMGLRPAYQQMARHLAQSGYSVLVINAYYRGRKAPVVDKVDFTDKAAMDMLGTLARRLSPATAKMDSEACVAFLDAQPSVDKRRRIGTVGYCMGGAAAFHTASAVPQRVGAVAAFHASGLASERPTSPHLLIPSMKAAALVGIAEDDDKRNPGEKTRLREAFAQAGLGAEIEVYEGAQHGWCTPDMITLYDANLAQRAWARLLALFERSLSA